MEGDGSGRALVLWDTLVGIRLTLGDWPAPFEGDRVVSSEEKRV